jgi:uncharacterized protein YegL
MDVTEDRYMVAPVYLVCEESASMADALGGLNEGIAGLIAEMMANPLLADLISLGLIAFSSSPRVIFRRRSLPCDPPPFDLHAGGPSRWGPAFRALARVVSDDVRLLRADGYERIHRPLAFFLVSGPHEDPGWNQVFRETLTYDRKTGTGMKQYPVFIPVGVGAGPSDETLRSLAYPQSKAPWTRVRDAAGVRWAVTQGMDEVFSRS